MEKILKYVNHHFGSEAKVIKTDLALVDEVDSMIKKAEAVKKDLQKLEDKIDEARKIVQTAEKESDNGKKIYSEGQKLARKLGGSLEDLGVEPRSNNSYNKLWEEINDVQDKFVRIEQKIKLIK